VNISDYHGIAEPGDLRAIERMASALAGIINSCASKWLTMTERTPLMNHIPFVVDIFLKGVKKDAH